MMRYILALVVMMGGAYAAFAAEEVQLPVRVVEVGEIHVSLGSGDGQITALNCSRCPITMDMNEQTRFYVGKAEIERGKVAVYSGNGGAVYFTQGMLAVKAVWYLDGQE